MSRYYEQWLDEQYEEEDARLATPEGRAEARRQEREKRDQERAEAERARLKAEQGARWEQEYEVEWPAWQVLQPKLNRLFNIFTDPCDYSFQWFLAEVGTAPPGATEVVQRDVTRPFEPGNLTWAPGTTALSANSSRTGTPAASPFLNEYLLDIIERLGRVEKAQAAAVVKEAYTTEEAAERLGRSAWTVRQWCNKGQVRGAYKATGRGPTGEWRIPHESIVLLNADGPPPPGTYPTEG